VHDLEMLLGVVCPALTISMIFPQLLRLCRGSASGVSLWMWVLLLASAEMWLAYGFVFGVVAEIVANGPNIVFGMVLIILVTRHARHILRGVAMVLAASGLTLGIALEGVVTHDAFLLSSLAVTSSFVLFLPQLYTALRQDNLSGVSGVTWFLALAMGLCWGTYGLLLHHFSIFLPNVVAVPASAAILLRVLGHRGRVRGTKTAVAGL